MVRPSIRAAKTRKVRTPSKVKIRKVEKTVRKAHCAKCGAVLHGVISGPVKKVKKLSKSEKLPTRIHAGYVCHNCLKQAIQAQVRS